MAGHGITVILYIVTLVEEEKKKESLDKVFYFCNIVSGRSLAERTSQGESTCLDFRCKFYLTP